MNAAGLSLPQQRNLFLVASGLSTVGSFAGLTAKGWMLMSGTNNPLVVALQFAVLALPSLVMRGPAGVLTDRHGCERVLVWAQIGLLVGALGGAIAAPLTSGSIQAAWLLLSTLMVGVASTYELTARNKYCALLVERPEELGPYLTAFSLVFNTGKLVGPPVGGLLVALTGPALALLLDASSYVLPIISVVWLLQPRLDQEQRSRAGASATLQRAWRDCGSELRHVLRFTALFCLVGFFHPGLAAVMASSFIGPSPQDLGLFTSVLAAGSISGGLVLQRNSVWLSQRPALLLGTSALITAVAQLGLSRTGHPAWSLAMAFVIGAGTAVLLAGTNLIAQVGAPQVLRGRMAGLSQIAFLGGGGISGLLAAAMTMRWGLGPTCGVLGAIGVTIAALELVRRGRSRLVLVS